jgi:hypothetical protein
MISRRNVKSRKRRGGEYIEGAEGGAGKREEQKEQEQWQDQEKRRRKRRKGEGTVAEAGGKWWRKIEGAMTGS